MRWNGQQISPRQLCRVLGFSYWAVLAECLYSGQSFRIVICRRIARSRRAHPYQYCKGLGRERDSKKTKKSS
jgi:hypothetical protein